MSKSPTSEPIRLQNVRLSFPSIYKAKSFEQGQEPRFQATFLLDPSKPDHKAQIDNLKAQIKALAMEAYGGKVPPEVKFCIGDGNGKSYDGYANMVYLASSNKTRPTIVNRNREPVAEGDAQAPYAGCYVNASITLWAQNNKFGKRINANLRAIQFVNDGEAFGVAPVDAEEEFEVLEGGAAAAGADDFNF